jgi:hypothetical protein
LKAAVTMIQQKWQNFPVTFDGSANYRRENLTTWKVRNSHSITGKSPRFAATFAALPKWKSL